LKALGEVKHVVSPNWEHVKFARDWGAYYEGALMWGCPGLSEREEGVRWTGELPHGCRPPGFDDWGVGVFGEEIEYLHFDCEANPFTGRPFFNEVVFYHVPSKTLMMTDTWWNYPSSDGVTNKEYEGREDDLGVWELAPDVGKIPFGSSLWKVGMDKLFRPFYMNLMVNEKDKFQQIVRHVTEQWEPETLIPAHGDIVRGRTLIKDTLRRHFGVCD